MVTFSTETLHNYSSARARITVTRPDVIIDNIAFQNITMGETVLRILQMALEDDRPRHVCTANLDHLAILQKDATFRQAYEGANLVLADGMPVVWLSYLSPTGPLKERVAGSDLFWELARASQETGVKLFLLGGAPGSADEAAQAIRIRCPGAEISGVYCPSFTEFGSEAEEARIAAAIKAARPHILLVGLGAPKQEKWIAARKESLGVPVCIGVGGSFEMAGGAVKRAPVWMQKAGLEWSYRLVQEPARLWRRYIGRDLPVLIRLAWRAIKTKQTERKFNSRGKAPDVPK